MPNLLMISQDDWFKEDMCRQISLYAPDYTCDENTCPDIIILNGFREKLSGLKNKYPHTPVIICLEPEEDCPRETARIKYVQKPIRLNEFLNKLIASISIIRKTDAGKLRFGKYELRPLQKEIFNFETKRLVKLTEKEVSVIQYLYKIKNRMIGKEELLKQVWGYHPDVTTHTIETHIYRLRQKVEQNLPESQIITTVDGGYMLKR